MGVLTKIFGTHSERELKRIYPLVDKVESYRDSMQKLSDEELRNKTKEYKERLEKGETLDDLLPEAFATVREAAKRVLGMEHYRVQIIGGIILHQGRIAEMKTGEGKTLVSTLPAYLNALEGKGVCIVTVNDYLAKRDSEWMGQVHEFLGLKVGVVLNSMTNDERREAYNCDITYVTNNELGFDYLRDNMVIYKEQLVQRGLHYAIIDEVDSVLIDEARTPLIISGQSGKSTKLYEACDILATQLKRGEDVPEYSKMDAIMGIEQEETGDFVVNEKDKVVNLTQEGVKKVEQFFKIDNLADAENLEIQHNVILALRAHNLMFRDQDYVVKDNEVMIVDEFTGRIMPGRRYSDGLHQAIEAKEHVKVKRESKTLATITFQNFFNKFDKKAGMTGTALTEEKEFRDIYGMDVIEIPTNKPVQRIDHHDAVYKTKKEKYRAVVEEVKKAHEKGQPVLVGTINIDTSELLSGMLKREGIPHTVLNAKFHELEAEIVAGAGQHGAVTIATNMAGRGTDIKLDDEARAAGGLKIIGTERHESRRIDNQLRGRSGRQGDPGCSQFFVSFEDELMQRFASEKIKALTDSFMDDEAIESKMVTKSIETAQKRVEGQNFDMRKQLLEYDDIMRQQREIMYKERDDIMLSKDLSEIIKGEFLTAIELDMPKFTNNEGKKPVVDIEKFLKYVGKNYMLLSELVAKNPDKAVNDPQKVIDAVSEVVFMSYENRFNKDLEDSVKLDYERRVLLGIIDHTWINHIDAMQKLRNGIYLRAYAQRDPLQEYTEEGFYMFEEMTKSISQEIARNIVHMGIRPGTEAEMNIPEIKVELEFK